MKKVLSFAVVVLIVIAGAWGFIKNKNKNNPAKTTETAQTQDNTAPTASITDIKSTPGSSLILFVGQGCPHCQKVEDYIKANQVDQKVQFDLKEVWYNKDNAAIMQQKADICKIPSDQLGVPLLFDGSKCYVGEVDITNYFNSLIGTK
jgi:glutaredoxin